MARRTRPEASRRKAITSLERALWSVSPPSTGHDLTTKIATTFVDALTDHVLEAADALIAARLEQHGLVQPKRRAPKRGGK